MNAQGEVVGSRVKAPVTGISWMSTGIRDTEHSSAGVYEAAITAAADVRFERRQEGERQRNLEEERKRQDEQAEYEGQAEEHRTTRGFFASALEEARAVFGDGPQFPAKSSEDMSRLALGGLHKWAYRHLALRTLSLQQRIEGGWYVGNEPIRLIENLHLLSRLSSDPAVAHVLQQAARSVNATRNMIEAVGDTARELNRSEMAQGHIWDAVVSLTTGADMAGVGAKPVALFDDDIKETLKGEGEPPRDAAEGAVLPRDIEQRFRQTLQEWQDEANSLGERAELFLKQTEGEAKTLPQVEAKVSTEEFKKNERVRGALKEHGDLVKVSRDGDIWIKARHYRVLVKRDPFALGTHWANPDKKKHPDFKAFSLVVSPHANRMRFNTPGGRVPITTGREGLPRMLTVEEVIPEVKWKQVVIDDTPATVGVSRGVAFVRMMPAEGDWWTWYYDANHPAVASQLKGLRKRSPSFATPKAPKLSYRVANKLVQRNSEPSKYFPRDWKDAGATGELTPDVAGISESRYAGEEGDARRQEAIEEAQAETIESEMPEGLHHFTREASGRSEASVFSAYSSQSTHDSTGVSLRQDMDVRGAFLRRPAWKNYEGNPWGDSGQNKLKRWKMLEPYLRFEEPSRAYIVDSQLEAQGVVLVHALDDSNGAPDRSRSFAVNLPAQYRGYGVTRAVATASRLFLYMSKAGTAAAYDPNQAGKYDEVFSASLPEHALELPVNIRAKRKKKAGCK